MNMEKEYEKMQLIKFRIAASMTAGEDTTLFSDLYQKHKNTHPLARQSTRYRLQDHR